MLSWNCQIPLEKKEVLILTTGERLASYRKMKNLTQQQLGDQLNISSQAVSKWENDLSEPDIATLRKLATLYGVSISDLLGDEAAPEQNETAGTAAPKAEEAPQKQEPIAPPPPVLAVCEKCNRPIYKGSEIVRQHSYYGHSAIEHIICADCDRKQKAAHASYMRTKAASRRKWSFILGGLGFAAVLVAMILLGVFKDPSKIALGIITPIAAFTLISCLLFSNNFIGEMIEAIAGFSIRMPGVIFSFDLDGIIWFITVKLTLFLLGVALSILCFLLAIALGLVVSIFVYPFALVKNINRPEASDF